jgi:hypothetical protein
MRSFCNSFGVHNSVYFIIFVTSNGYFNLNVLVSGHPVTVPASICNTDICIGHYPVGRKVVFSIFDEAT